MPVNPEDRTLSDEDLIALFTDPPRIPERTAIALMYDEGVNHDSLKILEPLLHIYITTVQAQGLSGLRSDFQILAYARRIGCTLVTTDKTLRVLHTRLHDLGLSHAGIIYVPPKADVSDLVEFVKAMVADSIDKDAPQLLHHLFWKV